MLSLERNRLTGEQLELDLVLIDQPLPPLPPPLISIQPSTINYSLASLGIIFFLVNTLCTDNSPELRGYLGIIGCRGSYTPRSQEVQTSQLSVSDTLTKQARTLHCQECEPAQQKCIARDHVQPLRVSWTISMRDLCTVHKTTHQVT